MIRIVVYIILMLASTPALAQTAAWPGCEGDGCVATGGRGGAVMKVTNLNDGGAGSLRDCLEATGARTCVFEVGGTIELTNGFANLVIDNPDLTVACQTAPGDGILISGRNLNDGTQYGLQFETDNIIMRYCKLRHGKQEAVAADRASLIRFRDGSSTAILDHISHVWAGNHLGIAPVDADINPMIEFTLSNSIVAETLTRAGTGAATALRWAPTEEGWGTADAFVNFDAHKNLISQTSHRHPNIGANDFQLINNYIWVWNLGSTMPLGGVVFDAIGNTWKAEANAPGDVSPLQYRWGPGQTVQHFNGTTGDPDLYITDNTLVHPTIPDPADDWDLAAYNDGPVDNDSDTAPLPAQYERFSPQPDGSFPIVPIPEAALEEQMLTIVGASRRLDCDGTWVYNRDALDQRLVDDAINEVTTYPVSTTLPAPGWIEINSSSTTCTDTDDDGIPAAFETLIGTSDAAANNNADQDADGFTDLEEYLSGPLPCHLIDYGDDAPGGRNPYDAATQWKMILEVGCYDGGAQIWAGIGDDTWEIHQTAYVCEGSDVVGEQYQCTAGQWQAVTLSGVTTSDCYGTLGAGTCFAGPAWSAALPLTPAEVDDNRRDIVQIWVCEDALTCGYQTQVFRRS